MAEIWTYAIPITLAVAGIFHYMVADMLLGMDKDTPWLILTWLGTGVCLVSMSLLCVYLLARNTTSPDLTLATDTAIVIFLVNFGFSILYLLSMSFLGGSSQVIDEMGRFYKR